MEKENHSGQVQKRIAWMAQGKERGEEQPGRKEMGGKRERMRVRVEGEICAQIDIFLI